VNGENTVHVAEVERDTALRGIDVAFERRAGAERDHRHLMLRADADDLLHVLRILRKNHRVGRLIGDPGERVAVLLAHRLRGDNAIAESCRQRGDGSVAAQQ